jgi:hypothetical protein
MSADYRIGDPERVKRIIIYCYECGKSIDVNNPIKGHEDCLRDDLLRFDVDWEYNEKSNQDQ